MLTIIKQFFYLRRIKVELWSSTGQHKNGVKCLQKYYMYTVGFDSWVSRERAERNNSEGEWGWVFVNEITVDHVIQTLNLYKQNRLWDIIIIYRSASNTVSLIQYYMGPY